jgi:hypothetical protein
LLDHHLPLQLICTDPPHAEAKLRAPVVLKLVALSSTRLTLLNKPLWTVCSLMMLLAFHRRHATPLPPVDQADPLSLRLRKSNPFQKGYSFLTKK